MNPKVRKSLPWLIAAILLAFLGWKLHTSHFDWSGFWQACRSVRWPLLLLATLIIYAGYLPRAARWAVFLRPSLAPGARLRWYGLVPSQFIGFAGLAALGRIGELIRPYLISKRTDLTFASQIAVVAVERIFDLGAFALIFSLDLLLSPELKTLPFHERFHQIGYAVAVLTAILIAFVLSVRLAGPTVARIAETLFARVSPAAGRTAREKLLSFRDGLNTVQSPSDLLLAALYSLLLWGSIAVSYVIILRAFPAPVSNMTIAHVILLMGFSVVGSVVQLPGIGGGAQALTIGALTLLFGVPRELATSAGMILWVITTMSVLPVGLLFARFEHISLRSVAHITEEGTADRTEAAPKPA